jgi:exodeoxyribonuclease V beta subunit
LCFAHLPGAPRVLGDRAIGEQLIARHAAQLVADWLAAAAAGELSALAAPPRIAVLAENHAQLDGLASALNALGLPLQRRSTRQRERPIEADWLARWLAALIEPVAERQRALDGTPFADSTDSAEALAALHALAAVLRQEGVVAALLRVAGAATPRLLQLAEALIQIADACDPQALLDALSEGAIGILPEPEVTEAGAQLHLSTVHAAKGLEFDLVLLPFAGARARASRAVPLASAESEAQREERLRNLYVALTRARLGVVVGLDLLGSRNDLPALYHLLGADESSGSPAQAARRAVEALSAAEPTALRLMVWPAVAAAAARHPAPPIAPSAAPPPRRPPPPAPALASYSSLLRSEAPSARDAAALFDAEPGGAAFGSAVHAVLEHADFAAWRGSGPLPAAESARVDAILARLPSLDDARARRREIEAQVRAALNAPLPEGLRLCTLPPADRRAELPFTLRLRDPQRGVAELARLAQTLRPAGIDGADLQAGSTPVAWLSGIIDLVYRHAGRWYLIDWKSNRLRPGQRYTAPELVQAVADSGYELQQLLYAVALDRWLTQRLPDYRRDTHFGGVRWLYLRGLQLGETHGIHAPRLPDTLLDAAAALIRAD